MNEMNEIKEGDEVFSFVGNWLCLDFSNTLHDRNTAISRDDLGGYSDLIGWSQAAGILNMGDAQLLLEEAKQHPENVVAVLHQALVLREVIYRIFSAIAKEDVPLAADLDILNTAFAQAMSRVCITQKGNSFAWDWRDKETALDCMVWTIIHSAAQLLISQELHVLRECAAEDCSWLFLDSSKNHRRRWCDMKSCGNRAKVGKHYEKKRLQK